mmetsp:Transcript_3748/g.6391  ORF Transcript_3748/g.6391 Transcript_3748/m.6391 type:complete len:110 (+) Transcript_3748:700-1029(+)
MQLYKEGKLKNKREKTDRSLLYPKKKRGDVAKEWGSTSERANKRCCDSGCSSGLLVKMVCGLACLNMIFSLVRSNKWQQNCLNYTPQSVIWCVFELVCAAVSLLGPLLV